MTKRAIWSGLALIIAGGIFLAATNGAGRSSKLGLIVGGACIVLGLVRILWPRSEAPPPV
jgi:O-antigen ligase